MDKLIKIAIGTDHRGVDIKRELMNRLNSKYEFIDCSKNNTDSDDYPDFAFEIGKQVAEKNASFGILICGTGIGMSIAANKVKGIRCALVHDKEEASLARLHNDANIIALGSYNDIDTMVEYINTFINTDVSNREEKHNRRINKIIDYEK